MDSFRSMRDLADSKQLENLCLRFKRGLIAGEEPRIEDFLACVGNGARTACLRALLAIELNYVQASGCLPSVDEYLHRFPNDRAIVLETFLQLVTPPVSAEQSTEQSAEQSTEQPSTQPAGGSTTFTYVPTAETIDPVDTLVGSDAFEKPKDGSTQERIFGDYVLLEPIARGGMGIVYKALQRRLNRTVALKMILSGELASAEQVRRFYVEAEAAAKLDHPGIVPVFEVGQVANQHFYSMAFVEGTSLASRLDDGPLGSIEAARLIEQVARAVQYAHEQGIIHRDLKPQNVLLDVKGQPRVTDFGLARNLELDSTLTASGQVVGTPSYMPPEQALGRLDQIGPPADVYALGATLYQSLTGQRVFIAPTPMDTILMVLEREPVAPRQLCPAISRDLETICLKCLRKDPAQRYPTAIALAEDLRRWLDNEPILARPVTRLERTIKWAKRHPAAASLIMACATGLLGYALVGLYLYRSHPDRVRAVASQTSAEADLRIAEAERLAAEATRLQLEKERNAAESQKRQLELEQELQKGLDVKNAWNQFLLDLQVINDRHTKTVTRAAPQRRSGYDPIRGFLPSGRAGGAFDPWGDSLIDIDSGFGNRYDPMSQPSSRVNSGLSDFGRAPGPYDPMSGQMNEFDPRTGRWRSRDQNTVEVQRYIEVTAYYQQQILDALQRALDSLLVETRQTIFWQKYVEPNSEHYLRNVENTDRFKEWRQQFQ